MNFSQDILIVTSDSNLADRCVAVCESLQLKGHVAHGTEEAFTCVNQKCFGTILLDVSGTETGCLQFLEWLRTLWLTTEIAIFATQQEALDAVPLERLQPDEVFVLSENDDWLAHKLSALQLRGAARQQSVFQEGSGSGQKQILLRWSPDVFLFLQKAQALSRDPFLFLVTGEKGVGKNMLARALLACAPRVITIPEPIGTTNSSPETQMTALATHFQSQQQGGEPQHMGILVHDLEQLTSPWTVFLEHYFCTGCCEINGQVFTPILQLVATSGEPFVHPLSTQHENSRFLMRFQNQSLALVPLRDRREDISHLVELFLSAWNQVHPVKHLSLDALDALMLWDWPGNVEELKAVVMNLLASTQETTITAKNLPPQFLQKTLCRPAQEIEDSADLSYAEAKKRVLHKFHQAYISRLLKNSQNNLTVAAEKARLDRSNFKKVMKKYGKL